MHIDLPTVIALGWIQTLAMGVLLWMVMGAFAGTARRSLRVWIVSLLLQAAAWIVTPFAAGHPEYPPFGAVVNAMLVSAFGLGAYALRMLTGAPARQWRMLALGAAVVAGIVWFQIVQPDYAARVYVFCTGIAAFALTVLWPLRGAWLRHGHLAYRVTMLVMLAVVGIEVWRLVELALAERPPVSMFQARAADLAHLVLMSLQPALASAAFLLLYYETAHAELRRLARVDPLTGVNNRRALAEHAARLIAAAQRDGRPFSALMVDADHFKRVNDRYGHGVGDAALCALVARMQRTLRASDLIGRTGGEEFVILLPTTGVAEAREVAERVRETVAMAPLRADGSEVALTLSIGVAVYRTGDADLDALLQRADTALYAAKHAGRNRVVAIGDAPAADTHAGNPAARAGAAADGAPLNAAAGSDRPVSG
ncbi:diguanylate cyclase [Mizugakiibacter sediminis]|uniref:diguanylate cyclase n=1 Tax=Mizugakiibacter sediminis TaxID=1475481 RepID=A0A0K8QRD2_9GAMM|nr:GGDEF domain-containing protein [Mizugakiibacter sediminis]GAP67206.1 diguanylate cyclase [Mizugakiibacter sediminis]